MDASTLVAEAEERSPQHKLRIPISWQSTWSASPPSQLDQVQINPLPGIVFTADFK